jgi:peptide/nickel transport system substrate-binding protein
LFLYDAGTASALSVLAAIYDGPVDLVAYQPQPVILVKIPTQADGDSLRTPVTVQPGELIVDASGELVTLQEGVIYRPSGCRGAGCEQVYSGAQPVEMDQWTLRFQLLPGLQWSDGVLLTADDSLYAFEVAQALYPAALPGLVSKLVDRTAAYRVLDAQTVEWSGVPGYQDGLVFSKFFSPLPRHAWGGLAPAELPTAEIASRKPLGWGPYVIEAWESGEQITLRKNPRYFRAREGLPYFDLLQFRFMADPQEAVDALLIGACDWIDSATAPGWSEALDERLLELREAGRLELFFRPAVAWE